MPDYEKLKVPDLKKLLSERSLTVSGNKAELVARLQESDSKKAVGGEDEIDWDEDDTKITTAPTTIVAAAGQGAAKNPPSVPNQKVNIDPSKTTDLKVTGGTGAPTAADGVVAVAGGSTTEDAPQPEAPKQDFSMGIDQTDAEKEAERRAARAKRFGLTEDEEEKKKLERAKKFGTDAKEAVVKGLNAALPERRPKRAREDSKQGGRNAKRQTPDRRTEAKPNGGVAGGKSNKSAVKRVIDDSAEKAKAEARAERFKAPAAA